MHDDMDETVFYDKNFVQEMSSREILRTVFRALEEKGYDPVNQIVGYLLSGDPAYITSYNNARGLIKQISRDEFIEDMLSEYIGLSRKKIK